MCQHEIMVILKLFRTQSDYIKIIHDNTLLMHLGYKNDKMFSNWTHSDRAQV